MFGEIHWQMTFIPLELVADQTLDYRINQIYMLLNPEIGNHPPGYLFIRGYEESYSSDTQTQRPVNAISSDHFFLSVIEQWERQVVPLAKTIVAGSPLGAYTDDIDTHGSKVVVTVTHFAGFCRAHRRKIRGIEIQNQ